jgi:restriction endonuclease S subunit
MNLFNNLQIPIPKSQDKIKEWVDKISKPYNKKIKYENKLKELETQVQDRIKEITENEECEEVELGSICEFKKGKQLSKENFKFGIYPVIGGGIEPTGYNDEYNMEKNTILCSSSGNNAGYINKYNTEIWASDCFGIIPNSINNNYIYYILKNSQQNIFKLQNGSAQPHVYSKDLSKFKLKIPKNKKLITNMDVLFEEIETTQQKIKDNGELYKQYIEELSNEAIPKTNNIKIEDITITEEKNKTKKNKKSKNIINKDIEL